MADKPKSSDKSEDKPKAPDPKRPITKARMADSFDSFQESRSADGGKDKPRRKK